MQPCLYGDIDAGCKWRSRGVVESSVLKTKSQCVSSCILVPNVVVAKVNEQGHGQGYGQTHSYGHGHGHGTWTVWNCGADRI
ncbi:Hypothetical predicted protein [Drosophila guanche]|uniref:Uncharacterized protein n=1 Tax=Drosophila guanche TaxID=7266 RepID=A0A3B0JUZ5_DROGU|nr:Hypothetical predicted protein [Drosophila guanche]